MVKKKKQEFQDFRNIEKSAYKTLKIPLKTILLNCDTIQPIINNLVLKTKPLIITPTAYFFYNFAYHTFKPTKVLILN